MSNKPTYDELLQQFDQTESGSFPGQALSVLSNNANDLFRLLFEHMLYEVHIWRLVREESGAIKTWQLIDANPAALANWGKDLEELRGQFAEEIFPSSNVTTTFMPIIEKIFSEEKPSVWEMYFSGTDQILHMVSIPVGELFISCGIDVTDIKQIESDIKKSQQRLEIATTAGKIGVWEYDLASRRLVWDDSMYGIYGVEPSKTELPFSIWSDCVHKDDVEQATQELESAIASADSFNSEFRIVTRDRSVIKHIQANAVAQVDDAGTPIKMIGVNIDITDRKNSEQQIEVLAYFDTLTGLPNRSMISDRLCQSIAACGRTDNYSALIFIDLDNFKQVNDTSGHAVGDELLVALTTRIKACIRGGDTFGRFGGDEFVIILNNLSQQETVAAKSAKKFALKVVDLIDDPLALSIGSYTTHASFGISLFNKKAEPNDVLRQADLAMYRAKATGGNAVQFFDPEMQEIIVERVELEKDLLSGIENEHFEVYYQIQRSESGNPRGAEALLRWKHPVKGFISPSVFIPIAEESGHIRRLGRWVFRKVCSDFKQMISELVDDTFVLSINVSAIQVCDSDFVDVVKADILESGVPATRIKLELTESALLRESDLSLKVLRELNEIDVQFSLDDFGTGYSSLTRLKELPIDELKIDQSFVNDILTNPDSAAIAKSIIALANSLSLEVIAEGVESNDQMTKLLEMGCHAFQGYLFSQPLPLDEFAAFLGPKK